MKIKSIIYAGMMIALVFVATYVIKIPIPFTQGYIHAGDAMIFLSAILFGPLIGGLAGGIGSAMADLFGGYAIWAFPTLIIKFFMGYLVGFFGYRTEKRKKSTKFYISISGLAIWATFGFWVSNTLTNLLVNIQDKEKAAELMQQMEISTQEALISTISNVKTTIIVASIIIPFIILMAVFSIFISIFTYNSTYNSLLEERKEFGMEIVSYTEGMLSRLDQRVENNEMTLEEAQAMARDLIRNMHFEDGNYIFGYDYDGNIVIPFQSREVGENLMSTKDQDGNFLLKDLIAVANQGGGYHTYFWPLPGEEGVGEKVSYVLPFNKWGWWFGAGVYVDQVKEKAFNNFIVQMKHQIV